MSSPAFSSTSPAQGFLIDCLVALTTLVLFTLAGYELGVLQFLSAMTTAAFEAIKHAYHALAHGYSIALGVSAGFWLAHIAMREPTPEGVASRFRVDFAGAVVLVLLGIYYFAHGREILIAHAGPVKTVALFCAMSLALIPFGIWTAGLRNESDIDELVKVAVPCVGVIVFLAITAAHASKMAGSAPDWAAMGMVAMHLGAAGSALWMGARFRRLSMAFASRTGVPAHGAVEER